MTGSWDGHTFSQTLFLHVSVKVFLDKVNLRISRLSKADGWVSSKPVDPWIKGWRRNSLPAFFFFPRAGTSVLSCCQTQTWTGIYTIRSPGFSRLMIAYLNFSVSIIYILSSAQFSCSVVSDSLQPYESQHSRPPCPTPTPIVYSNSCPSSQWWYPAISSSVIPFSSCPQSLPPSGSFPMSQLFAFLFGINAR